MKMAVAVEESSPPRKKMKIDAETLIPEDLILQSILPFLPIKSAIRFQAVSKPWRNFIKHPFFTRLHLSVSQSRNPTTFLILSTTHGPFDLSHHRNSASTTMIKAVSIAVDRNAKTIEPGRYHYAPIQAGYGYFGKVVGVCYGVLCVCYGSFALLCNPAIGEVTAVQFSSNHLGISGLQFDRDRVSCVGFGALKDGYGNVVNFKLVAMVRDVRTATHSFAVYSLNTNKWTLVKSPIFRIDRVGERAGSVFINGVIYWLAWGSSAKESAFVLTFDIISETFGRIELPTLRGNQLIVMREQRNTFLSVFDSRYLLLSVVATELDGVYVDVWALIDEDNKKWWSRAEKLTGPLRIGGGLILGYWADGNAVIVRNGLSFYLHTEDKCSILETGLSRDMTCLEYFETLVSPKRISEQDIFQDID